jgi:hypothetical protein
VLAVNLSILVAGLPNACVGLRVSSPGAQFYFEQSAILFRSFFGSVATALGITATAGNSLPPICPAHACPAVMTFFLLASALAGAILGGTRYEDEHATAALSFLALFAGWPFFDALASRWPCPPLPAPDPRLLAGVIRTDLSLAASWRRWPHQARRAAEAALAWARGNWEGGG